MNSSAVLTSETTWCMIGCGDSAQSNRRVPLVQLPFRVGRLQDLPCCLADPTISKQHAEFRGSDAELRVRDLGSTNGTFVNGKRIFGEHRLNEGDLVQFASLVFRLARERAGGSNRQTLAQTPGEWPLALIQFDRLLNDRLVIPHFQPIVRLEDRRMVGYESLGRSNLEGLQSPLVMFNVATTLGMECELSAMLRAEGIRVGAKLPGGPALFVNTHPSEMQGSGLLASLQQARGEYPGQPIVLEIHEAAITDPRAMRNLRAELQDLDIGLAYDDFGSGQGRLAELVEVPPDYLKFDIKLVRNLHLAQETHRQMLSHLVRMIRDFGIAPLAEGVECAEEASACHELGFELAQGYHFGRPQPIDHYMNGITQPA